MRVRRTVAAVLMLLAGSSVCLGALYTWTAGGANDYWTTGDNWSFIGQNPYPQTTSDDAVLPYLGAAYTVELTTEEIDDLTISGNVDFESLPESSGEVCADTVTIGHATYAVTVTIDDLARITTNCE